MVTAVSPEDLAAVLVSGGATSTSWIDPDAERGRLSETARRLAQDLSPQGAALVRVKPFRSDRARAALVAAGLDVGPLVAFAPSLRNARFLAVVAPASLSRLFELAEPALGRFARPAAAVVRRPSIARALAPAMPNAALLVRGRGAAPPLAWLASLVPGIDLSGEAVVIASRRDALGGVVVHAFAQGEVGAVAKVAASQSDGDEERGLTEGAESAGRCGIASPKLLAARWLGDRHVVVETPIRGRIAALDARARHEQTVTGLAEWLLRWNRETRVETPDGGAWLRAEGLALVSEGGADAAGVRARLLELAARLDGRTMPLCASHGDLTLWNVLVDVDGALGVVDWETARARDLPLGDFFYLAADAWLAAGKAADRAAAVRACFFAGGDGVRWAAAIGERWRDALALPPAAAEAAFLVTWLRHALVENRRGERHGEFLDVLRAVTSADGLVDWIRN